MGPTEIAQVVGSTKGSINQLLRELVTKGDVLKEGRGLYTVPGREPVRSATPEKSATPGVSAEDDELGTDALLRLARKPQRKGDYIEYPIASGAVGANWEEGATHDDGERVRLPRDLVQAMVGHVPDAKYARWTFVRGDSMEPFLIEGTPIFVERVGGVTRNGRYIIWYDDDIEMVKRVEILGKGHLLITADNMVYPPREYYYRTNGTWDEVIQSADDDRPARTRVTTFHITERVVWPLDTTPAILRQMRGTGPEGRR